MNKLLTRFMIAIMAIVSMAAMVPQSTLAATGPWQWSDISDKLTARNDRPVWAMARAESYWYLTDGQELSSGGHVWRTDGSIMDDITTQVRNAGLSRVDDIVSDGQMVIFLKNVVSNSKNYEALSLKGGTYGYPAYKWQSLMDSDEGLASIDGKNGEWMLTSTKGRIFRWVSSNDTYTLMNVPMVRTWNYSQLLYSTKHTSPIDGHNAFLAAKAVPTSNGWIFIVPNIYYTSPRFNNDQFVSDWTIYNYTATGGYVNLTSISSLKYVNAIASNGTQVMIVGGDQVTNYNRTYLVEGTNVKQIYNLPSIAWNRALISHNGKSWMIVSGKDLVRFDGTNFETYGRTRDYFVTSIGNGNGTFLLGGAVSTEGANEPTSPLTAKLVRADEGTSYTPSNNNQTSTVDWNEKLDTVKGVSNNITYWAWFNPGLKNHDNVTDPKYTVGAQSNDGIKKIELYINGVRQRVCDLGNSNGNVECSMFIESTGYTYGSDVNVEAKITSGKDKIINVPMRSIRFYDTAVSATMSVGNNTPYLYRGSSNSVTINGYAGMGIERMEVVVNGQVKQTCYAGSDNRYGTCNISLIGNDYNAGSGVAFNGRVIGKNGQEAWTWLGYYTVVESNGTYYDPTYSNSGTNWFSFDPSGNDLYYNQSKTIKAQAYDTDGLKMIEILVNGQVKQTCYFNRAYGTQSCQATIYGSNYNNYTSIPVYTRATDYNNNAITSATQYLNTGNTNNNNYDSTLSAWFGANVQSGDIQKYSDKSFEFYGQSTRGLRQLDLYANDVVVATCTYNDPINSTQSCTRTVNLSNYSDYQTVKFRVRATDKYSNTNWSPTVSMRVVPTGTNNNQNSNVVLTTTGDLNTYYLNESFTLNAYATDYDGLQRIELYANDVNIYSCGNLSNPTNYTCSATVRGSDYTGGSMSLPLKAKATDRYGNVTWSMVKYVQISGTTSNYNTTVSISLSPDKSSYTRNESFTVSAYATDGNGIQKVEMYVNNSLWQTCNSSYGTSATCSANVTGSNYPSNVYSLPIQIRVTDNNGQVTWSTTKYVSITDGTNYVGNNQETDVKGNLSINSTADDGYTSGEQITFTANGSDNNGIERIEIYVNADLVKTCYNASTCSYTASYSSNYLTYGAKMTDKLGNSIWNGYKTIYKK